ncbi:MAG: ATP-dependent DNA helicase RecG [Patescibacteria group bacterium]
MEANITISQLPGIGQYYSYKLKRLAIETLEDLIYHFPFRYDDFTKVETIRNLTPGEKTSVQGIVWEIRNIRTRGGRFITRATVADESGTIEVIWFNQPYLTKTVKAGTPISLSGKIEIVGRRCKMLSPSYEILRSSDPARSHAVLGETLHTGRLVPVYPETEGVTSKWLRAKIAKYLKEYTRNNIDFLPEEIKKRQDLIDLGSALVKIHFPKDLEDIKFAKKRLSFDELFTVQFIAHQRKLAWQKQKKAPVMQIDKVKVTKFIKNLPFRLTGAQTRATREILADLREETPANRLLEGDVGSGKTIVAATAAYVSLLNGYDVLIAAPTEILAFQHQKTLSGIFAPVGIGVGIWTGSKKQDSNITCGTHALLSSFKPKRKVGFVVVDEQHRFGVAQRAKLFLDTSGELTPHLLTMTATPIPRTLALTLYGDLALSVLDEMPQGRQKIATFVVPNRKRDDAYKFIEKQVRVGHQAFIITPFVEPSETMSTVKAATVEFANLKNHFSPNIKLGLLHGRLKSRDKEKIMESFKKNAVNILVTTPVVEVGIDVPNAVVMMIESAERFGLAQLHQLRGRVGRGKHKSYCLLFTDSAAQNSLRRLKSMEKVHVGFELAEIDLKMRGPGEIFGLSQSGFTQLKIADLSDEVLISKAQNEAKNLAQEDPDLKKYPNLAQKIKTRQLDFVQPN